MVHVEYTTFYPIYQKERQKYFIKFKHRVGVFEFQRMSVLSRKKIVPGLRTELIQMITDKVQPSGPQNLGFCRSAKILRENWRIQHRIASFIFSQV